MAKVKNQDFRKLLLIRAQEEKSKFIDLLFNSQKIEGLPEDEPDIYVKQVMFDCGYIIATKKYNDKWHLFKCGEKYNNGEDIYGEPNTIGITFENGKFLTGLKLNEDAFIIRYTPNRKGLKIWLDLMCEKIARIDLAIENNLILSSMGFVYSCDDVNKISLKEALRQASEGDFAVFASQNITDKINTDKVQAQFYGDKLYALKEKYVKEVLTRLVGVASTSDKKERTTSYDTNIGESIDTAYIYVDTFNNDCEKYQVPFKMSINSTIEELYNAYINKTNINEDKEGEI